MNDIIIGLSSGVVFLGIMIWILTWVKGKADKNDVNSCLAVLKADMEKDLDSVGKSIDLKADQRYVDAELKHGEKQFTAILKSLADTNSTLAKQAESLKELCLAQRDVNSKLSQMWDNMEKRKVSVSEYDGPDRRS